MRGQLRVWQRECLAALGTLMGFVGLVTAVLAVPSNAIAALKSHWNFNQGSGSTVTDVVGGFNGTIQNGAPWMQGAACGPWAVQFLSPGGNQIVAGISADFDNAIGNKLTIAAWVKRMGSGNPGNRPYLIFDARNFCGSSNDCDGGFTLYLSLDNKLRFDLWRPGAGPDITLIGNTVLTPGWHHVAAVFDGSAQTIKLYVDGALDLTQANAGSTYAPTGREVAIGNNWWALGDNQWAEFKGMIDAIRIYDDALAQSDITTLANECSNLGKVPTLTQWGVIALTLLLAGAGLLAMRRRGTAEA